MLRRDLPSRRPRAVRGMAVLLLVWAAAWAAQPVDGAGGRHVTFAFVSDLHYGLTRPAFRGGTDVRAQVVNHAMVDAIRELPGQRLPADAGVAAGQRIGTLDFVAEIGRAHV